MWVLPTKASPARMTMIDLRPTFVQLVVVLSHQNDLYLITMSKLYSKNNQQQDYLDQLHLLQGNPWG